MSTTREDEDATGRDPPSLIGRLLFGGMLGFGSAGIRQRTMPALPAGAVATFLAAITHAMHDF